MCSKKISTCKTNQHIPSENDVVSDTCKDTMLLTFCNDVNDLLHAERVNDVLHNEFTAMY